MRCALSPQGTPLDQSSVVQNRSAFRRTLGKVTVSQKQESRNMCSRQVCFGGTGCAFGKTGPDSWSSFPVAHFGAFPYRRKSPPWLTISLPHIKCGKLPTSYWVFAVFSIVHDTSIVLVSPALPRFKISVTDGIIVG